MTVYLVMREGERVKSRFPNVWGGCGARNAVDGLPFGNEER